jgi:hypothetical protein
MSFYLLCCSRWKPHRNQEKILSKIAHPAAFVFAGRRICARRLWMETRELPPVRWIAVVAPEGCSSRQPWRVGFSVQPSCFASQSSWRMSCLLFAMQPAYTDFRIRVPRPVTRVCCGHGT